MIILCPLTIIYGWKVRKCNFVEVNLGDDKILLLIASDILDYLTKEETVEDFSFDS